jgi:hypothetical protein
MFTIGPEFRQIVFPQPKRAVNGLQAKIGFGLSPQASPFIPLMYHLEAGISEQRESSLRISAVDQESRSPLGQPFVIKSRNGIEPTPTLGEGLRAQRGKRNIPLDHHLGVKRNCLQLDCSKAIYGGMYVPSVRQPKASGQRPCTIVTRLRQRLQRRACFAASSKPGTELE